MNKYYTQREKRHRCDMQITVLCRKIQHYGTEVSCETV